MMRWKGEGGGGGDSVLSRFDSRCDTVIITFNGC